jgi:hypothetical protein
LRPCPAHIAPAPGLSREVLGRELECHQARTVLGAVPERIDDPYALPDRWLDIDVDADRDGFVVTVSADDFDDARRVFDRAHAFAAKKAP